MAIGIVMSVFAGGTQGTSDTPAGTQAAVGGSLPIWRQPMAETVTLTCVKGFGPPEAADTPTGITPENQTWVTILRDQLNIKLDFLWTVPSDQYNQKLRLTLASGTIPDILQCDVNTFYEFVEADALRDMRPALDQFANPDLRRVWSEFDDVPLNDVTVNGELLAVPNTLDNAENLVFYFYRQDWLDALGLQVPKSTKDVMDVAVAFAKRDPNKSGTNDTYGLSATDTPFGTTFGLHGFFQSYGAYPGRWLLKDGMLVNGTIQPEVKVALDQLRQLYKDGGISQEFATLNFNQIGERMIADRVGSFYGGWWVPNWPCNLNKQTNPDADWKMIPLPGPDGKPAKSVLNRNTIVNYNVVSKKAPKGADEAVMKMLSVWFDISYGIDPVGKYGDGVLTKNGWVWNYTPILCFQARAQAINMEAVLKAIDTRSTEHLLSEYHRSLYNAAIHWLELDLPETEMARPPFGKWESWGLWYSRVAQDGGIGLAYKVKNDGMIVYNEFYGPPVPTELEKASTLQDMTVQFYNNYIMGAVATAEWDKFVTDWKNLGGDAWTKEANKQYKDLMK